MQEYCSHPDEVQYAAEREAFLNGDCWLLAHTLHRMFGFRIVFAVFWPEGRDNQDLADWYWDHVFVETHAGHPLDVEGRPSLDRWRKAPEGYVRGFHVTSDSAEISVLLADYLDAEGSPRMDKRVHDTPVLPAIIRLSWQWPEAFRKMRLKTMDDLPLAVRAQVPAAHSEM